MTETAYEAGMLTIASEDGESWLRIGRHGDAYGYSAWSLEVSSLSGFGARFCGANRDVHFTGLDTFIAAFDAFILDRRKPVALEGTYDCRLAFAGDARRVWLQFAVADGSTATPHHAVSGGFHIAQDELLGVLAGFRALQGLWERDG